MPAAPRHAKRSKHPPPGAEAPAVAAAALAGVAAAFVSLHGGSAARQASSGRRDAGDEYNGPVFTSDYVTGRREPQGSHRPHDW